MGVNWGAGLMRWRPHGDPSGKAYSLHHLHPLHFVVELPASDRYSAVEVEVRVGFSMHTFTRGEKPGDDPAHRYSDDRETRIFDIVRYELSKNLPDIVRTLDRQKCYHGNERRNFFTVDQPGELAEGHEYQVFFDLRRWHAKEEKGGRPIIQLIVQSAYAVPHGQAPRGRRRQPVGFRVLINGILAGNRPGPSRY